MKISTYNIKLQYPSLLIFNSHKNSSKKSYISFVRDRLHLSVIFSCGEMGMVRNPENLARVMDNAGQGVRIYRSKEKLILFALLRIRLTAA